MGRFWKGPGGCLLICLLLLGTVIVLSLWGRVMSPFVLFLFVSAFFILGITGLVQIGMSIHGPSLPAAGPRRMSQVSGGSSLPRTAKEAHAKLSDEQFEYFSAAVVVALGEGHRFLERCGGSGDQGVDTKLRNQYSQIVAVQSKRYASDVRVPSRELRDFGYALHLHLAVYGYFVTTSTFTDDAKWVISASHGRIRPIDGPRLDSILKYRAREVDLAMTEINSIRG